VGELPFVLALNKSDLAAEWEIGPEEMRHIDSLSWTTMKTSARTGAGVEEAFAALARRLTRE
jgi:50S ribosomal subunit-associated GTPase HflX